jgi:hypothetical protein
MRTLRRIAAAVAVPVAAGAAVALLPATAQASAAGGTLTLCSRGSYASQIEFPNRGHWISDLVQPGQCRNVANIGNSGVEQVNVDSAGGGYIASFQWDISRTLTINTIDTSSGRSFYLS